MPAPPTTRWRALAALVDADRARWAGVAALAGLGAALPLAGPLVVRRIVDRAQAGADADELTGLAVAFLALAVATQLVAVLVAWAATTVAWRAANDLRIDLARHVLDLDHGFHRSHTPGELIQRIDGDVTAVSDLLGRVLVRALGAVLLVVGMVVVLAVLDLRLASALAAYVVLAGASVVRGRGRAVAEAAEEMGANARLYGGIEERLTAAEDLRSAGAGHHASWRFIEDSAGSLQAAVRRERAFLRLWWSVQLTIIVGAALAIGLGATLVSAGVVTVGTAFLLLQYTLLLKRPLEEVVHELETIQKANGAMVRVAELLSVRPAIADTGTTSPPSGPLAIELAGVSFDYGDDEPVLHHIDWQLAPGRSVGVVGRTGSGKTTLSRLVLRLVEASAGTVRLGGVPIAEIPLAELRRRVALIPQEVELLAGSVRDNVALFDDDVPDDEVVAALRRVGLDDLVAAGIHRPLGAAGAGLSAGQAQLLALARVWVRDPDLVVLDEATARIDPATEARLEAAVGELLAGRTAVVIAHRLSTLRHLDEVLVVADGRVLEHGPRARLAGAEGGRYRRLLELALEPQAEPA